jgi:hypothetical protein
MPPSFESLKRVTIFHGGWIAAVFVLPGLLLYSYLTGDVARPLYSLAGYYALTALFPPQRWWWWVESMSYMAAPYFKRQRVVFDNGSDLAEQPRASKLKSPPVTPLRNRRKPSGNSKTDNSKGNDSANDNKGTGLASLFPWLPAPFNPDPPPPQACSAAAAMGLPPPRSKVLVALAPHGIMSFGLTCLMSAPEIRHSSLVGLVADAITNLPIIREMLGWSGISSCSKKSMTQLMEKGENLIIIPGGFQVTTLTFTFLHRTPPCLASYRISESTLFPSRHTLSYFAIL